MEESLWPSALSALINLILIRLIRPFRHIPIRTLTRRRCSRSRSFRSDRSSRVRASTAMGRSPVPDFMGRDFMGRGFMGRDPASTTEEFIARKISPGTAGGGCGLSSASPLHLRL